MTATYDYPLIQRVLVGSQAHGLADPIKSDYDYREVFYIPAWEQLQIPRSARPKDAWDSQSKHTDDEGGWEIAKLFEMVTRGHPNAIEVMFAPNEDNEYIYTQEWEQIRAHVLPHLLCTGRFVNATLGYGQNCLKKLLLREHAQQRAKWKSTYLRIMYSGIDFLNTGVFPVRVPEPGWGTTVRAARNDEMDRGDVFNLGEQLERDMRAAAESSSLPAEPNMVAVNEWLSQFRKDHWDR